MSSVAEILVYLITGGGIVAITNAVVRLINSRHKNRQEAGRLGLDLKLAEAKQRQDEELADARMRQEQDAATVAKWRELYELSQRHNERQTRRAHKQDELNAALIQRENKCQIQLTQHYEIMKSFHDTLRRWAKHGIDGEIPDMPAPPMPDGQALEFLFRQNKQDVVTMGAITEEIKELPKPDGEGAGT